MTPIFFLTIGMVILFGLFTYLYSCFYHLRETVDQTYKGALEHVQKLLYSDEGLQKILTETRDKIEKHGSAKIENKSPRKHQNVPVKVKRKYKKRAKK